MRLQSTFALVRLIAGILIGAFVLSACHFSVAPEHRFIGSWILQTVDGAPPPYLNRIWDSSSPLPVESEFVDFFPGKTGLREVELRNNAPVGRDYIHTSSQILFETKGDSIFIRDSQTAFGITLVAGALEGGQLRLRGSNGAIFTYLGPT